MSRPKTAAQSSRKFQKSFFNCPLSSTDAPIVSDLEHKAGHCFCHHCSCGQHSCPGDNSKFQGSTAFSWSTQYKHDYPRKSSNRDKMFLPKEYKSFMKTSHSTKNVSINQSDFVPQAFIKSDSFKPETPLNNTKFSARSSYARDFADWKSDGTALCAPVYPYRGYMVKNWHGESLYKNDFKAHDKQGVRVTSPESHIKSLVSPGDRNDFCTTTGSFFKQNQSIGASTPDMAILRNKKELSKMTTAKGTYTTSYKSDFTPKPVGMWMNRLR